MIYDNDFRQLAYYFDRIMGGDAYDEYIEGAYAILEKYGFIQDGEWVYEEE